MHEVSLMFSHPELYKKKMELDRAHELGLELENSDEFISEFKEVMEAVPKSVEVIELGEEFEINQDDKEFENFLSGFVKSKEDLFNSLKMPGV